MSEKPAHRGVSRLATCLLWLGAWQVASLLVSSDLLLPGPLAVLRSLLGLAAGGTLLDVGLVTLSHVALGFVVSLLLALSLGHVLDASPAFRRVVLPGVTVLKSAPIVCVVVLLLLWFGAAHVAEAAVFLACFPPLLFAVLEGLGGLDPGMSSLLRIMRVPRWRRALASVWPQVLPFLVAASRSAVGMAWKAAVAAELIGSPLGSVGERVFQAKLLLETSDVFAWTALVILASRLSESLVVRLLESSAPLARSLALVGLGRARAGEGTDDVPATPIVARGLSFSYGGLPVIGPLDLELGPGARVCLSDASGSGKTTFLRLVCGELDPSGGSVGGGGPFSLQTQGSLLVEELGALQNVLLCAPVRMRDEAARALGGVLPGVDLSRPVSGLSGGQRRRVELVRALLSPSRTVLLDEPFSGLDAASRARCHALVDDLLGGRTLVMASHDEVDAQALGATSLSLHAEAQGAGVAAGPLARMKLC